MAGRAVPRAGRAVGRSASVTTGAASLKGRGFRAILAPMASGSVLVVDGDSPLGRGLVRLLRQAGYRVAGTCRKPDRPDQPEPGDDGADALRIPWGRSSAVSARNVMLRTLTAFERVDVAVFCFAPSLKRVLLHEADFADIDAAVDDWIRGTLLLLREVLGQLVKQGGGVLALVQGFAREEAGASPPLEATVRGAVADLSASLLASYGGAGVSVVRFETASPKTEEYARFVAAGIAAEVGRPPRQRSYRYRPSGGLLEKLPLPGRRGAARTEGA